MSSPIYNDPLSISERFAHEKQATEAYALEFQVPPSGERIIAQQTSIQNVTPSPPELVRLMGGNIRITWAKISPPPTFFSQHIFSNRFAPLMGYSEKQDADMEKIASLMASQPADLEIQEEGQTISMMLDNGIKQPNNLVDFIQAKMREFVSA